MIRCRVSRDELYHDLQIEEYSQLPSLFDLAEDVCEELGPEPIPVHGHYIRVAGKDVFVKGKMKFVGPKDGFQLLLEEKE